MPALATVATGARRRFAGKLRPGILGEMHSACQRRDQSFLVAVILSKISSVCEANCSRYAMVSFILRSSVIVFRGARSLVKLCLLPCVFRQRTAVQSKRLFKESSTSHRGGKSSVVIYSPPNYFVLL